MNEYWIVTTSKGMLPAGRKVGFITADNEEAAEAALMASGQIPPRFMGHFGLEFKDVAV